MKNLFVPYEIAILAKEKGFNDQCFCFYDGYGLLFSCFEFDRNEVIVSVHNDTCVGNHSAAPLYQQLIDWFREKHNIKVYVVPQDNGWVPFAYSAYNGPLKPVILDLEYYEALDKALTEAFKLLTP